MASDYKLFVLCQPSIRLFVFAAFLSLSANVSLQCSLLLLHCYTIRNTIVYRVLRKQRGQCWQSKMSVTIRSCLLDICVLDEKSSLFNVTSRGHHVRQNTGFAPDEWLPVIFFQNVSRQDFSSHLNTDWSQHWLFLLKGWGLWRAKG